MHVFVCRATAHKGERRFAPHKDCLLIHTLWFALPSASQTSRAIPVWKAWEFLWDFLGSQGTCSLTAPRGQWVAFCKAYYGHPPKDNTDISFREFVQRTRAKLMPEVRPAGRSSVSRCCHDRGRWCSDAGATLAHSQACGPEPTHQVLASQEGAVAILRGEKTDPSTVI